MVHHLLNDIVRYGSDVCAHLRTLDYVDRIADTCTDNLCINSACLKNLNNIGDQIQTILRNVI